MAHTNQTPHFDLPQFLGTDKASWIGDINPAMLAIDTALFQVHTDSSDAASNASAAQQSAQAAETAAELAQSEAETATEGVATLKTRVDSITTEVGTLSAGQTSQGASITALQTDVTQLQTDVQSAEQLANAAQQTASANSGFLTLPAGNLSVGQGVTGVPMIVPSAQGYQFIIPFRANIRYNTGDTTNTIQIYGPFPSVASPKHMFMLVDSAYSNYGQNQTPQFLNPYDFVKIFGNYTNLTTIATVGIGTGNRSGIITIAVKNLVDEYANKGIIFHGTLIGTNQPLTWRDYSTGTVVSDPYPAGSLITL